MTETARSRIAARLPEALAEIRARGFRMTPQRQLILETIYAEEAHLTAEQILSSVRARFPGVNMSTVYRNLEMLERMEIVCHAHLGHAPGVYHSVERRDHQHLVCRTCSAVEEINVDPMIPMRDEVRARTGFEVDLTHFALYGTCVHCRPADAAPH
ncbi:MAG: transcriptional repressor [Actinomycetota bacterium]